MMTRIMGLDVGEKTIGVAVSDPLGWTAQGLNTLKRKSLASDIQRLIEIVEEQGVEEIVVGLPTNMNGTQSAQTRKVIRFIDVLHAELPVQVRTWDERLTTKAAHKTLLQADVSRAKRKKVVDKLAAVVILQGYLDFVNAKRDDKRG